MNLTQRRDFEILRYAKSVKYIFDYCFGSYYARCYRRAINSTRYIYFPQKNYNILEQKFKSIK